MKLTWHSAITVFWPSILLFAVTGQAAELVVTNDLAIGANDARYEGMDLRVQSGRLMVEGGHTFATLTVTGQAQVELASDRIRFEVVTRREGALVALAGGALLEVAGDFVLADQARIECAARGRDALVEGAWLGVGVTIWAWSVEVGSGARIVADGQGYLGSTSRGQSGKGPGGGGQGGDYNRGGGGGHGGRGIGRLDLDRSRATCRQRIGAGEGRRGWNGRRGWHWGAPRGLLSAEQFHRPD